MRFFKSDTTSNGNKARVWLPIKIKRVYLGYRMSKQDVEFYTSLIHSILGDIEVRQIGLDELNTGLR